MVSFDYEHDDLDAGVIKGGYLGSQALFRLLLSAVYVGVFLTRLSCTQERIHDHLYSSMQSQVLLVHAFTSRANMFCPLSNPRMTQHLHWENTLVSSCYLRHVNVQPKRITKRGSRYMMQSVVSRFRLVQRCSCNCEHASALSRDAVGTCLARPSHECIQCHRPEP